MVGIGTFLALFSAAFWWRERRRTSMLESRSLLGVIALTGPLAVIALETGWVTTEVGRQPWIAYGLMRTSEAVTDNSNIFITFAATVILYVAMGVASFAILRSMSARWRRGEADALPSPYSPEMHVR
jgi:cytochrome d ubiquinol oxidase subunit I